MTNMVRTTTDKNEHMFAISQDFLRKSKAEQTMQTSVVTALGSLSLVKHFWELLSGRVRAVS
jgi:hypothetical protein